MQVAASEPHAATLNKRLRELRRWLGHIPGATWEASRLKAMALIAGVLTELTGDPCAVQWVREDGIHVVRHDGTKVVLKRETVEAEAAMMFGAPDAAKH